MKNQRKERILLILSMVIFGTIGAFRKQIPLPAGELALYRAVLAIGVLGLYLVCTGQGLPLKKIKKQLPWLLASGAAIGINWILLFAAYDYTTVSVATLSYYFAPVLVTAACPILFAERLTKKQVLCLCMCTLGMVLIPGLSVSGKGTDGYGILLGLGAAVFYASVILMNKRIRDVSGIHRTLVQFVAAAVVLFVYVLLGGQWAIGQMNTRGWSFLLIVGIVHTGITYCMYFSSLSVLSGQRAAILSYIDPLVAVLISVVVLHEPFGLWQAVGGCLILGFSFWNEK